MKSRKQLGDRIVALIDKGELLRARKIIEAELGKTPENHWFLTQLGLTYYEDHEYAAALGYFRKALKIAPACPLATWNLAGALDMLDKPSLASRYYRWIIDSTTNSLKDSCWESTDWTDSMKASCVYRLALCQSDLGRKAKSIELLHSYVDLLLNGVKGFYSFEEVMAKIQKLQPIESNGKTGRRTRRILESIA